MLKLWRSSFVEALVLLVAIVVGHAGDAPQSTGPAKPVYQKPPKVIMDILESPAPPMTLVVPLVTACWLSTACVIRLSPTFRSQCSGSPACELIQRPMGVIIRCAISA